MCAVRTLRSFSELGSQTLQDSPVLTLPSRTLQSSHSVFVQVSQHSETLHNHCRRLCSDTFLLFQTSELLFFSSMKCKFILLGLLNAAWKKLLGAGLVHLHKNYKCASIFQQNKVENKTQFIIKCIQLFFLVLNVSHEVCVVKVFWKNLLQYFQCSAAACDVCTAAFTSSSV